MSALRNGRGLLRALGLRWVKIVCRCVDQLLCGGRGRHMHGRGAYGKPVRKSFELTERKPEHVAIWKSVRVAKREPVSVPKRVALGVAVAEPLALAELESKREPVNNANNGSNVLE